jgi:hypothetical protein
MRSVAELNRGEHDQLAFSSILERIRGGRKTFFSSLFNDDGMRLLKRLTMVISKHRIEHVFYPVFPPDRSASDVVEWFRGQMWKTSGE